MRHQVLRPRGFSESEGSRYTDTSTSLLLHVILVVPPGVCRQGACVLQMAAAMGALTWLCFDMASQQQSLLGVSCGALAGLVAITPAMAYVSVAGAMVMGLVATTFAWCARFLQTRTQGTAVLLQPNVARAVCHCMIHPHLNRHK